MKLKRIARKTNAGKAKKPEALISKNAGGLCFDFNEKDSNMYEYTILMVDFRIDTNFTTGTCRCRCIFSLFNLVQCV